MQDFEEDYYAILGVSETAKSDEIKRAYLNLAKKLHPDRHPNDAAQRAVAQKEFARVTRAHDVISDEDQRAEYDAVRLLQRKKEEAEAQAEAQAATGLSPSGMGLSASLEETAVMSPDGPTTRSMGKPRESITGLSADENINVKWANKHLERAEDLLRKRRYQEAETAMKEAIRLVPKDPKYHNQLAEIYHARGWNTLALTEVQTALRIDPKHNEARTLEKKIQATIKDQDGVRGKNKGKKGFFEQLKEILTKKF